MPERRPELGWMRIFVEVARLGSLSAAAAVLGLTQPAVSYQIRRLEEQFGVSLLRRQHRGVELTAEGVRLFQVAAKAVALPTGRDPNCASLPHRPSRGRGDWRPLKREPRDRAHALRQAAV